MEDEKKDVDIMTDEEIEDVLVEMGFFDERDVKRIKEKKVKK